MTAGIDWDAAAAAHPGLTEWLAVGNRGLSSESIVFRCVGVSCHVDWPYDVGDFGRCEKLFRQIPTLRPVAYKVMPTTGPVWAGLVAAWGELAEMYDAYLDAPDRSASEARARSLSRRVHGIRTDGYAAARAEREAPP